jgi:hypothetical protein
LSENIEVIACWTDCNSGNQVCNIVLPQTSILICACAGSVTTLGGNADITYSRPCCVCNEYTITNFAQDAEVTACWTTCDGNQVCDDVLPQTSITICACAGSITITGGNADITLLGPC